MNNQKTADWMKTLKPGDHVALRGGGFGFNTTKAEVSSVTPTGRVRIGESRREFNPDGYERGSSGYRRARIAPWTDEIANEVRHHELAQRLGRVKWEQEPLAVLERVAQALAGQVATPTA